MGNTTKNPKCFFFLRNDSYLLSKVLTNMLYLKNKFSKIKTKKLYQSCYTLLTHQHTFLESPLM